jgi:hypothetical protein
MDSSETAKNIKVWMEDVDESISTFSSSELLDQIPCIGDMLAIAINEQEFEYFQVIQRYFRRNGCSLIVKPVSGKGFEYKRMLQL